MYLNFDGDGQFVYDPNSREDATTNTQPFDAGLVGALTPYGNGAKRDYVFEAVAEDFAPYGVIVTDVRPPNGNYIMLVFTPDNPSGNPNLPGQGTGDDCNNAIPNNIYFIYLSNSDPYSAELHANMATRSLARTIGLELVRAEGDVMSSTLSLDTNQSLVDACQPLYATAACPIQHSIACPDGSQNAHAELTNAWGLVDP